MSDHDEKPVKRGLTDADRYEREETTDLRDGTQDQPAGWPLHTRFLIAMLLGVGAGVSVNVAVGGGSPGVSWVISNITESPLVLFAGGMSANRKRMPTAPISPKPNINTGGLSLVQKPVTFGIGFRANRLPSGTQCGSPSKQAKSYRVSRPVFSICRTCKLGEDGFCLVIASIFFIEYSET